MPHILSPVLFLLLSDRTEREGEVSTPVWDDVALLPQETQKQILGVLGPMVDSGTLKPAGYMNL